MPEKQPVIAVIQSVSARTCAYFKNEFGFDITENNSKAGNLNTIELLDTTVVIVMGGAINLLVVFSFDALLLNAIYDSMMDGLDVEDNEIDMYRNAAAGDVINTVLGHSTIDLQKLDGNGISITPPTIVEDVKTIQEMQYTMFYAQSLITPLGKLTISLVGSDELFSTIFCPVK